MGVMLLLSALVAARLDAAVETGGYVGTQVLDAAPGPRGALDLTPSLAGTFDEPGLTLEGRYAPRLFFGDAGAAALSGVRQDASVAARWQESRSLQLAASARVRYGRNEFAWDAGAARPFDFVEFLLPVIPDELSSDAELGFSLLPARNFALNLSAGYLTYGGLSAASQHLLPFQQGPQLYAGLEQQLDRNDALATELYTSETFASGGRRDSLLRLTEGWTRQLDSATRSKLAVGGSAWRKSLTGEGDAGFFPVASLSLERRHPDRDQRLDLGAEASLGPHRDPLTAELLDRAEMALSARFVLREDLSIGGRAAAARELGPAGARLLLGAADLAFHPGREITLALGAESVWQELPAQGPQPLLRWMAFTSLTVGVRDIL